MEAIAPLALISGFLYSAWEVFKLVKKNEANFEHYAIFVLGLLVFSATRTNIFVLAGMEDIGTDFFWNVSFLLGAIISVPVSGVIHDGAKIVKRLSNA
ncbi:hypothetical protein LCGC14_1882140 [marine sediment metagenome]|uniref:Uncharacterized protein n=1 Tax=marine sediment metagenome TaxID=412755 RepID=A0A0F9G1Z2_9ZZZZ